LTTQRVILGLAFAVSAEPLGALEEIGQRDPEGIRKLSYDNDGRAPLPTLYPTDVVTVDIGLEAELLLRETTIFAKGA